MLMGRDILHFHQYFKKVLEGEDYETSATSTTTEEGHGHHQGQVTTAGGS